MRDKIYEAIGFAIGLLILIYFTHVPGSIWAAEAAKSYG